MLMYRSQDAGKDRRSPFRATRAVALKADLQKALLILAVACAGPAFSADKPADPPKPAAPKAHIDLPLPANAEHLSHGRFDDVIVYKPTGTPTSFALVLSGDHGWNAAASELAEDLVKKGAMVTGIDTPQFVAMLERDDGDCEYTSGDLENLSHFVQAYYKLPTYLPPVMLASGEGAPLAYGTIVQAPDDTFGGALLLGFRPDLPTHKPLCTKGNNLEFTPRAGGQGFDLQPAPKLSSQVTLLQGEADKDYPPAAAKDFAAKLGKGSVVELPGVDLDYADPAKWQPQLLQVYEALQQALKPTELALPPADLNGLPIIEVPAKAGVPQTEAFAILISGDGGWAGLDQEVAGALSADGIPVVGVDSLRYFWTARTPESAAADTDRIVRYYLNHWHKQQVLLVGYSQGADVMPFIINRLPAETRKHVALGAVMGLSEHALFEFHVGNWVNANQDQGLPTAPEMEKPGPTPMLCIYGEGETDTLCPKLNPAKVRVVKLPGGHHFGGDYQRLAREILATANLQPLPASAQAAAQTSAAGGDQNESSNKEESTMTFHLAITPLLSLIAGILILLVPRLLNYIVAIYLILLGVLGMFPHLIHVS
jgi:type IV secretory pathway VirJ component